MAVVYLRVLSVTTMSGYTINMQVYNFTVVVTQDEDGMFVASVPQLRGCHTLAKTLDELYKRAQEVIELCLEVEREKEQPVPHQRFLCMATKILEKDC